jgi:hypothetical protein
MHKQTFQLIFYYTCNTLLVDIFQDSPSAAAASGNIVRCALSAGGIACMQPLMGRIGEGWYFVFLAVVGGAVGVPCTQIITTKGMEWRLVRDPLKQKGVAHDVEKNKATS